MEPKTKKIARPKFLVFDEAQIDSSILFNNTKQYSPYVQFDIQIFFHWGNFSHPLPSRTGSDGIICSASRGQQAAAAAITWGPHLVILSRVLYGNMV